MALPGVDITINANGLGALPKASRVIAKVGASSVGTANSIISVTEQSKVRELLGYGPLADACIDAFGGGKVSKIIAVPGTKTAGTLGAFTSVKTGASAPANNSSSPDNFYELVILMTVAGGRGVAKFKYSLDGERHWSDEVLVPAAPGNYTVPNTGISVTFAEDATPEDSYDVGDKHSATANPPTLSSANLGLALDALHANPDEFDHVHIVGETDDTIWAAVEAKLVTWEAAKRWTYALCEGTYNGTVATFVTNMQADAAAFSGVRVGASAAFGLVNDPVSGLTRRTNLLGLLTGRVAQNRVHRDPAAVADGAMPGVTSLLPSGINDGHIESLDTARFITFRKHVGLAGFYVTNFNLMAGSTSDFKRAVNRRVINKAAGLANAQLTLAVNAELDVGQLESELAALGAKVKAAIDIPMGGEISGSEVSFPAGQNPAVDETLRVTLKILPYGYIRYIEAELGLQNPLAA